MWKAKLVFAGAFSSLVVRVSLLFEVTINVLLMWCTSFAVDTFACSLTLPKRTSISDAVFSTRTDADCVDDAISRSAIMEAAPRLCELDS